MKEALAQPAQQNPVAWLDVEGNGIPVPVYTAPPQRTWVRLTEGELVEACQMAERGNYLVAFQHIQTKLKEKNT